MSLDAKEFERFLNEKYRKPVIVTYKDVLEKLYAHYVKLYGADYMEGCEWKFKVMEILDGKDVGYHVHLSYYNENTGRSAIIVAYFDLVYYPYCCGIKGLNGFWHSEKTDPEIEPLVHAIIDAAIDTWQLLGHYAFRWVSVFIERSRRDKFKTEDVIPEIENPSMKFPYFYSWAKKQKKCQSQLMHNPNSGNVMWMTEVVR